MCALVGVCSSHHLGDNLLTAVSVARECGMIEPDHQAIMVKADSTSAGVHISYHLLGEGRDLAELLRSGQATPMAADSEQLALWPLILPCPQSFHLTFSPVLSSYLVPSPFILPCPQSFHFALSPVLSYCLVPSPFILPCPQTFIFSSLVPRPILPSPCQLSEHIWSGFHWLQ